MRLWGGRLKSRLGPWPWAFPRLHWLRGRLCMPAFGAALHFGFEMPRIEVENLTIDIPVLSLRARSLRAVAVEKARSIGGRIVSDGSHVTVVRGLDQVSFPLGNGGRLG